MSIKISSSNSSTDLEINATSGKNKKTKKKTNFLSHGINLYLTLMEHYSFSVKIPVLPEEVGSTKSTLTFQLKLNFDLLSLCICMRGDMNMYI